MALLISYARETDVTVPALLEAQHLVVGVVEDLNLLVVPHMDATWSSFIYRYQVDLLADVFRMYEELIDPNAFSQAGSEQFAMIDEAAAFDAPSMKINSEQATLKQQAHFERIVSEIQPNLMSISIEAAQRTARRL